MSILAIKTNGAHTTATADETLNEFKATLANYVEGDSLDKRDALVELLHLYAVYSYVYLARVSETFKGDPDMKETMTFMNSVLAEVCHAESVAYFHKELGYTVTDQAIKYMMERGEEGLTEHIIDVIREMNKVDPEDAEAEAMIKDAEEKFLKEHAESSEK